MNDVRHYLWRAVDHKGEVPECYISRRRKKNTALENLSRRRM
ncbi:DDE-type integrase/transposase/recombinase [Bartonella apis]|nr:DDE-type integrase/transposase/recombinase [Bartonella apis]